MSKKVTEKFHNLQVFCLRCVALGLGCLLYCPFATRVAQLEIWHFSVIGIEGNVCRCAFNL